MTRATLPLRRRSAAALAVAAGALLWSGAAPAAAAEYVVTKTADTRDGSCDADCSLREAVEAASAAPDADVVTLGPGSYDLTRWEPGDADAGGGLSLTGAVTVRGAGPSATTVRLAVGPDRHDGVFDVRGAGTRVVLEDFTVTGGNQWGIAGGGITAASGADLTLRRMIVRDNVTDYNAGTPSGGGLRFAGGALLIEDSAFLGNTGHWGGALGVESGSAEVVNTTFTGNRARVTGGAISVNAGRPVALRHVTIAGNASLSGTFGGAIGLNPAGVTIQNSVVAGNGRPECDASGTLRPASRGGNVGPSAATDSTCQLTAAAGDLLVDSPGLADTLTVGANGVPVLLPLAGSHAIGAVAAACSPTDATGRARPVGTACAAGAAEPAPGTPGPGRPDPGTSDPGAPGVDPPVDGGTGSGGGATDTPAPAAPAPVPGVLTPADTKAPTFALPKRIAVDARRRRASLALACPAGETRCTAEVRLERVRKVKGKRRTQRLAARTVTITGGATAKLRLKLTRTGRAVVAGRRTAKVTLRLTVRDAAGNQRVQRRQVTLRVAAR